MEFVSLNVMSILGENEVSFRSSNLLHGYYRTLGFVFVMLFEKIKH